MTKSQEQRMNELAEDHADEYDIIERSAFKYGYQAAIKEAEVLVEALELISSPSEWNCAIGESNQRAAAVKALKKFKGE